MRMNKFKAAARKVLVSMAFLLVVTLTGVTNRAHGQAPGLLWRTNIGVRLFSVDAQTNVYANAGGTVIRLSGEGVPLQTIPACPIPGFAERDSSGNFYFTGNFDGTQDFGGITLVGGRISNLYTPPRYVPGYPSGYLAKYGSAGNLLWVVNYPYTGGPAFGGIRVTDLLLDTGGAAYVCYDDIFPARTVARFNSLGSIEWENGAYTVYRTAVRLGGLTATNFSMLLFNPGSGPFLAGGKVDKAGNYVQFDDNSLFGSHPAEGTTQNRSSMILHKPTPWASHIPRT